MKLPKGFGTNDEKKLEQLMKEPKIKKPKTVESDKKIKHVYIKFPKMWVSSMISVEVRDVLSFSMTDLEKSAKFISSNMNDLEKIAGIPSLERVQENKSYESAGYHIRRHITVDEAVYNGSEEVNYRVDDFDERTGYLIASQDFTKKELQNYE